MDHRLPTPPRDLERTQEGPLLLQHWLPDPVSLVLLGAVCLLALLDQLLVLEVPGLDLEVVSLAHLEVSEAHLASQDVAAHLADLLVSLPLAGLLASADPQDLEVLPDSLVVVDLQALVEDRRTTTSSYEGILREDQSIEIDKLRTKRAILSLVSRNALENDEIQVRATWTRQEMRELGSARRLQPAPAA